jgi:hypothetical protein
VTDPRKLAEELRGHRDNIATGGVLRGKEAVSFLDELLSALDALDAARTAEGITFELQRMAEAERDELQAALDAAREREERQDAALKVSGHHGQHTYCVTCAQIRDALAAVSAEGGGNVDAENQKLKEVK